MGPPGNDSTSAATSASVARESTRPFDPHSPTSALNCPGKIARLCTFSSRTPAAANDACKRGPNASSSAASASSGSGASSSAL